MLFSFFYLFFKKMVAWHAMRQKCHISNAKWIIARTQLNQMPPSDSRPPSRGGLVNLHQAWFVAIGFSRNLAHFLIKTKRFLWRPLVACAEKSKPKQINVKSSRRSRLSHLFISFFSPIHSSRWAALRPAAHSVSLASKVRPTLKQRLASIHFNSFPHWLFFSSLLILHAASWRIYSSSCFPMRGDLLLNTIPHSAPPRSPIIQFNLEAAPEAPGDMAPAVYQATFYKLSEKPWLTLHLAHDKKPLSA